ncbi:MAG TPA: ABC transporter permease [Solirubrobacteraceae bacterium]|nr:ABC transporter permease [Solirubrobacteraceae bacterium]
MLALVCALGPIAFAALLASQSGVPGDTLLGVWVHTSGYAIPFVVLGFGGFWGFPLLAGVLAGDLFSSEDRYGTWKTILTRSASRGEVFTGKILAAATLAAALVGITAISSLFAGLLFTGDQPLVGLSGTAIPPGECLLLVLASWLVTLLPVLAFTSLAALFSLATRNGIAGVLAPVLVGLAMHLLGLIGSGTWLHMLLLASAFDDWHGLLTAPKFFEPLIVGGCVCLLWTLACLGASWAILRARGFAGTPVGGRRGWVAPLRWVAASTALLLVLGIAGNWGPAGITQGRLEASITPVFNRLTRLQQAELGRSLSRRAELDDRTLCRRRSGSSRGPGDDWSCVITIVTPRAGELETVGYDLSVESDGCYKADAPTSFVGQQSMSDARGRSVVNPLFTIYGCFDTTAAVAPCADTSTGSCARTGHRPPASRPRSTGRSPAELKALHEAEQAAGPTVMRKINEADSRAARESERPGPGESELPGANEQPPTRATHGHAGP